MAERPKIRSRSTTASKARTGRVRKFGSSSSSAKSDDIESLIPRGLAGAFVNSKLHEKKLREAGLSAPDEFEGEMPELPDDIDKTDHSELSNMILAFQSALSTATWQAAKAYIAHDIYDEIGEYLENRALLGSDQSNDAKRKAEAKTDDDVVRFRGLAKESYHDYVRFRDLAKTIEGKVKVLSRVGGFKDDDNDASDRTSGSKASKGASRGSARRRTRERD